MIKIFTVAIDKRVLVPIGLGLWSDESFLSSFDGSDSCFRAAVRFLVYDSDLA